MPASPATAFPIGPAPERAGDVAQSRRSPSSALRAASVGYRVPCAHFDGIAIAVFTRACYVDCGGGTLLTVGGAAVADGPTNLLLGSDAPADLRIAFRRGDSVACRAGVVRWRGTTLDLRRARIWRAPAPRPPLAWPERIARGEMAARRLAFARRARPSVLDRDGEAAVAAVADACRRLDVAATLATAARLVGWGEGLTPAGDDFLVGLAGALHALRGGGALRRAFVARVAAFLSAQRSRTTPFAAHALALAATGDFNGDVLRALDALRSEPDARAAERTLSDVLAVGATSGADMLTGMLAGWTAWTDGGADGRR